MIIQKYKSVVITVHFLPLLGHHPYLGSIWFITLQQVACTLKRSKWISCGLARQPTLLGQGTKQPLICPENLTSSLLPQPFLWHHEPSPNLPAKSYRKIDSLTCVTLQVRGALFDCISMSTQKALYLTSEIISTIDTSLSTDYY